MLKYLYPLLVLFICKVQAQETGWQITAERSENYTGIVTANGRIGILPDQAPFGIASVILNNVYEKESELGVSKIVKGMNFGNLELSLDGEKVSMANIEDWSQTLDMKRAVFTTRFRVPGKAEVRYHLYALRHLPYTAYLDVEIIPETETDIEVTGFIQTPESFQPPMNSFRVLQDLETTMPILQSVAKTSFGRHTVATSASFIWHDINSTRENQRPELKHEQISESLHGLRFEKRIPAKKPYKFAWAAAQTSSQDFADPQTESERFVIFTLLNKRETLIRQHEQEWARLWQGDIQIEGDLQSQLDVRLALYHLYAFSREDSNLSIAPMGLSSQNYNGHIFWDTELWMYPPLLLLQPDIALSLLNYRSDRLDKAKQKAINFGYRGAMFPWESDDTGEEATPAWALTGTFEHHITADIAIAFWNYYQVTKDLNWLKDKGYPMLKEVADYWVSRVTPNKDGSYSIHNVVGANEFAPNVDDNAFTNGSAITALKYATEAAQVLQISADPQWNKVADGIRILKFPDGTTREHAAYNGEVIKQADANLLTYPLELVRDKNNILKDLRYYEPKLSPEGPAMGQSVFAVIYARLGDAEEAFRLFKRSYEPNKRPPFGALAEAATSNNPYFATGAGGMLQAVLFGFGGLHITESGVKQINPILPPGWKSLTITGVGKEKKTFKVNR